MRVAAIYDIHGNLPALEAVLDEIRRERFECLVIGGDIVPGPLPGETLELLRTLDLPKHFIRGNGDRAVSETKAGIVTSAVPERVRPALEWCASKLTHEQCIFINGQAETIRLRIDDLCEALFCHATPRSDTEIFTKLTPEVKLYPVFDDAGSPLVICGHTHMQFERTVGRIRVVNAGSIGAPFGDRGAYWLALGPGVQLRRTEYDFEAAAAAVRATDYVAKEAAATAIVSPVTEGEMLRVFGEAELQ